jgi:hypothetical protein
VSIGTAGWAAIAAKGAIMRWHVICIIFSNCLSPLIHHLMETPANNRRRAPRLKHSWEVLLDEGEGRTHDIGATGVYFETNQRLEVDSWIHFVMLPPEPSRAYVWCEGRVVRVEPLVTGLIGVGLEVKKFHCVRLSSLLNPTDAELPSGAHWPYSKQTPVIGMRRDA